MLFRSKAILSRMMVGRDIDFDINKVPAKLGEEVLSVKNLNVISPLTNKHLVNNVSFNVRKGEVV